MSLKVSVVMPVYNEEKHIDNCVQSLLQQDFPQNQMEWIFVDGMSQDRTIEKLWNFRDQYPKLIKVYENPNRTVPYAMNIGIAGASGECIIRLDAHADYASDYISKCVYYLETVDAENVGGVAETKANGFIGGAIAKMLSSKFGVGNSQFRTGGESGYVDTVPFGAFRRDVFTRYGGYDERLTRNQDNEMNYRIRKNGGKIYLSQDIRLSYYCRDSIKGIAQMAFQNGTWNVITMKLCPGSMGLRHFIPLAFVISLAGLSALGAIFPIVVKFLIAELAMYLLLDLFFSFTRAESWMEVLLLISLFPIFHITYGCGSIRGLFKLLTADYRKTDYQPPIL